MSSWNLYDSLQELKTLGLIDKKVEHKTVINLLNEEVLKYTNRRSWAKHIGVSTVFICKVLSQDSWPNKEMLRPLNLKRLKGTSDFYPFDYENEGIENGNRSNQTSKQSREEDLHSDL